MSILKTENLVMQFGGLTAVNNLSLDIKENFQRDIYMLLCLALLQQKKEDLKLHQIV